MKKDRKYFFIGFIAVLFSSFISAQDSTIIFSLDSMQIPKIHAFTAKGYLSDLQSFQFTNKKNSLITGNQFHHRMNLKWKISKQLNTRLEVRNRLYIGEFVKQIYQFGKIVDKDNGVIDLSYNIIDDSSVVLNSIVDRAVVNWSKNNWDISLGRQRINWGVNLVWNPNDIFNAFNYFDFDYEERPGTDALRIQYYSGSFSSFEWASKLSTKSKEQVSALMYKTNYKTYDFQCFAGIYYEDIATGLAWAGNLRKMSFKGEASYFHALQNDGTNSLVLALSLDRTFSKNYFALISYLFTSNGNSKFENIVALTNAELSAKNLFPFKHSFFIQGSKSFENRVSLSMSSIFSPKNNTLIMLPIVSGSLNNNWELAGIAQIIFAKLDGNFDGLGTGLYLRTRYNY